MSDGAVTDSAALRAVMVEQLRAEGGLTRDDLARAFATIPREIFVSRGFRFEDGFLRPGDAGFLEAAYRNDALVTKLDGEGTPVSSSSQPSLMALMIEALGVEPGMRVLEIGAGTGYNAALMCAIGADVTSVDAQHDVAEHAATALAAVGAPHARVRLGDGYLGDPEHAPYDRVIVTVGVNGVSPHWLDQLAPGGAVLAPVTHAGNSPVMRMWTEEAGAEPTVDAAPAATEVSPERDGRVVRAAAYCDAGFMRASGPLTASYPWAHPEPVRPEPGLTTSVRLPARWKHPLSGYRYRDLWFALGAWDRRVTGAGTDGDGGCVLCDEEGGGGAAIRADGSILAAGPHAARFAAEAQVLVDRWDSLERPDITRWWATMALTGDPRHPIYVPRTWSLLA